MLMATETLTVLSAGACELADMTQAVTYAAGTLASFDYVVHQEFTGEDIYFPPGQDFPPGQAFAKAMDFSGGPMTFKEGTAFTEIQGFNEAGAFSGTLTITSERPTTQQLSGLTSLLTWELTQLLAMTKLLD